MTITPVQKGNSIFRPRARLIKTIGEELISSDKVAVLELVKNSYDADASIIVIEFKGRVEVEKDEKKETKKIIKEGSSIDIYDDGTGMTLQTLKEAWMEPATISKKLSNKSKGKKRRYTGEKGIGRFSSARLSSDLEIITRPKNDNEIIANFSWKDFDKLDLFLDQVKCLWEVRNPVEFSGDKHGTKLFLNNLNSDWDGEKIRDLKITLQRLINPVVPVTDFLIELKLPEEFESFSGIVQPPESLTKPNYSIKGIVDKEGIAEIEYKSKKLGITRIPRFSILKSNEKFKTGPFGFDFRVWDRDPENIEKLAEETNSKKSDVRKALNEIAGISIYRDGFRVLPYGDPKTDWLRLDLRRVNNPTQRISNNQIIGFITIELEKNPEFIDQSNREGIVESETFDQLKDFVKILLNQLEIKRYEERPREDDNSQNQAGIFSQFSIAPLIKLVKDKLPNDKEANEIVSKVETSINKGIEKVQDILSRYRRLSTLGLLIDVILHDGNNFLLRIDNATSLLAKELSKDNFDKNKLTPYLNRINEGRQVLAQLFRRLEPFGGRKRGSYKNIILEDVIADVFGLYQTELTDLGVKLNLPASTNEVTIDEGELRMIFVNLLQNSLYWLKDLKTEKKINVEVEKTTDGVAIVFSDNGPGIKEEHHNLIFDPYFSTRPDGVGLGLTIVGELVNEYEGDFFLIDSGPLDGATFKLTFRKRV